MLGLIRNRLVKKGICLPELYLSIINFLTFILTFPDR